MMAPAKRRPATKGAWGQRVQFMLGSLQVSSDNSSKLLFPIVAPKSVSAIMASIEANWRVSALVWMPSHGQVADGSRTGLLRTTREGSAERDFCTLRDINAFNSVPSCE